MSSPQVQEAFLKRGIPFYQGYGLTEAGPNLLYSDREDLKREGTIGRRATFVDLKLINDAGSESDFGELYVGGPIVFTGYIGREAPELVEGYVRTGDLLERDRDGFYYFRGRKKFMYKSGGENIYPTEIENVFESHPAVIECAVIGVADEKWGEVGKAFVVLNAKINENDLIEYGEKHLAKYKMPKHFSFVDEIPKTSNGKKDYVRLKGEDKHA